MRHFMQISFAMTVTAWLLGASVAWAAGGAHVHGVAKLDIAVDSKTLTIQLESPLDNFVGFEHAPRTDAKRKLTDAAIAKLRAAASMFKINPAAQCRLRNVELSSAALKLGKPDPQEEKEGHSDIDGSFEFVCVDAAKATYVDVALFEFSHLQRIEAQVATANGQFKRDLKRPISRIVLTR